MKRWKIYVGVVVVVGLLGATLCLGQKENVINSSAEENVNGVNVSISATVTSTAEANVVEATVTSTEQSVEATAKADDVTFTVEDTKINQSEAYKQMVEEEEYIVNLVNEATNGDLTTDNWKECLNYLRSNYISIEADASVDMEKVDSYVYAYNIVEVEQNMPLEDVNENAPITRAKYDPKKVTEYTDKYWENYNSKYPNFDDMGGDCANFVSQALYEGGKQMKGTDASNFANWFCRSKTDLKKISSTWRGADAFGHYWRANALGYKTFDGSHFTSKEACEPVYNYTNVGDAISFLNYNGRPYHTVICSYKNRVYEDYPNGSKMIHFASHTGSHKWKSVYNYLKNMDTAIRVYDMY